MCGRMTQNVNAKTLVEKYALGPETRAVHLEPQFNGAPGQEFATVRHDVMERGASRRRALASPHLGS